MSILLTFPVVAEFYAAPSPADGPWCSAVHSGNIGDIIYSLPTCRMLEINHLILNLCADPTLGGRVLLEQSARSLAPLLLSQRFIRRVTIVQSNVPLDFASPANLGVDYILDSFRASYTDPRLHLVYAHAVPYNIMIDATKPWLDVSNVSYGASHLRANPQPYIVAGLTSRYKRFDHTYYEQLFRNVPADRVYFVGVEKDQIERMNIGGMAYQTNNFLDIANLIANAALFIGNPTFTYALAEALKVHRFVEVPETNNVYPLDGTGWLLHQCELEFVRTRIFDALQLPENADRCFLQLKQGIAERDRRIDQQQQQIHDLTGKLNETSRVLAETRTQNEMLIGERHVHVAKVPVMSASHPKRAVSLVRRMLRKGKSVLRPAKSLIRTNHLNRLLSFRSAND